VIPDQVWSELLDEFARTSGPVERVAFLDGVRSGDAAVVTTLTIPDAELFPGHYEVSAQAMSQAGAHLRQHRLARIAQVHTHGLDGCHHSSYDDEMAYSQRDGAISIVLPQHAAYRPAPHDGAIHRKSGDRWIVLDPAEAATEVRVIPAFLDFRRPEWIASPTATKAPSTGVWRRLTRFVRRRSR
jgi:hypothetical protein